MTGPIQWPATALALAAAGLMTVLMPAAALAGDAALPAAKAGELLGLAEAAAKFCPAGVVTEKGKALAKTYTGADAEAVATESAKVLEAWTLGAACDELKMDRTELTMCRTMRLRNCRAVWTQLGPDGTVIPGLVDTDYSKVE